MRNAAIIAVALGLAVVGCKRSRSNMIQNKGSDTLVNLAQYWAEEYKKVQPKISVAVSGGGSGTGIAALINGTVDIANASRKIKDKERKAAKSKQGKEVVQHIVAYDALAVYLNKANPNTRLTRKQLACIYGEKGTCNKWTDIGKEVPGCSGQTIVRVSRQNNSGTYVYFRNWALQKKQDFKLGSRDMSGSKDVVDLVTKTPCAIGYSGLGYNTPKVATACVTPTDDGKCAVPTIKGAVDGSYPIARALYMYTLGKPKGKIADYIKWVQSAAGQKIVLKAGYAPVPASGSGKSGT